MERSNAAPPSEQQHRKSINELAGALKRASEAMPLSVVLRRDIVDSIYEHLLNTGGPSQATLAHSCEKFVTEGLPDNPVIANAIVGELLYRFESARSEMLGEVGMQIMQAARARYKTDFASLSEFYNSAKTPGDLVTIDFKDSVSRMLSAYNASAVALKKEFQALARSLGYEISDESIARLTLSELEETIAEYLHAMSAPDSKDRGAMYGRIAKGTERDSNSAMEQLIHSPDIHKESWDAYISISSRAAEPANAAANDLSDLIKGADSSSAMVDMLSYSLFMIGRDHYLALELIRRFAPEEIDGYSVMGDHVNSIAEALASGQPARVFLARRKLLAMISRKSQKGGAVRARRHGQKA